MQAPFYQTATGEDAGDAFLAASYADMGSYPPTGIGQKHGFMLLRPADGEEPKAAASRLVRDQASPIFGLSAPAGCIPLSKQEFLFFGWARNPSNTGG